jgi:hypothetical protein
VSKVRSRAGGWPPAMRYIVWRGREREREAYKLSSQIFMNQAEALVFFSPQVQGLTVDIILCVRFGDLDDMNVNRWVYALVHTRAESRDHVNCESPKESVQRRSQHTSKIM